MSTNLTIDIAANGVATLTMNRAERHNAFDDHLIEEMTEALVTLDKHADVRVVVLAATGKSFSAGADLGWMKRMATYSEAENLADAKKLAHLMHTLDKMSKPTVGAVQGPAYGGGVGLVACCDMVFAAPEAMFALTEVKLGLIPAVISPYVVRKMGASHARRYFISAERFDAKAAQGFGLVHEIVPRDEVLVSAMSWAAQLLNNGPMSMAAAKKLAADVADHPICDELNHDCAQRIATQRVSAEGQEGLTAFLEKRAPNWVKH
jgi:methylglutaconyl-CoA hydratase